MPQTLANTPHSGSITHGSDSLGKRPDLAVIVATAICQWASVDARLAALLVRILGGSSKPSYAMFSAIHQTAQQAALDAAARAALSSDDYDRFRAVLKVYQRNSKTRNQFAHWIWGHCDSIPDALLLLDPSRMFWHEVDIARFQEDPAGTLAHLPTDASIEQKNAALQKIFGPDGNRIWVYRKSDLDEALERFKEVAATIFYLDLYLRRDRFSDDLEHTLLPNLHQYREALSRIRRGSKGSPETPE